MHGPMNDKFKDYILQLHFWMADMYLSDSVCNKCEIQMDEAKDAKKLIYFWIK